MTDNNNQNNNGNNFDWISWLLIVILFSSGLWFVALPMLFLKLFAPDDKKKQEKAPPLYTSKNVNPYSARQNMYKEKQQRTAQNDSKAKSAVKNAMRSPKNNSKSATALLVFGIIAAFIGLVCLADPISSSIYWGYLSRSVLSDILQGLAISASGIGMIFGSIGIRRSMKRYSRYLAVIGSLEAVSFESISKKLGYRQKLVIKDLQKMIDKGYFGPDAYLNMELGYMFRSNRADAELSKAKKMAEQKADQARTAEELSGYEAILKNIRDANDLIADPVLSEKISRLESITAQIFKAVEADPTKKSKIDTFLSYYLPTTQKLLDSYAQLESTGVDGENVSQTKKSIEGTMDSIVHGFEYQLDELYKSDALDIETDIKVMKTMMGRDMSSASSDFAIKKDDCKAPAQDVQAQTADTVKNVDLGGSAAQEK